MKENDMPIKGTPEYYKMKYKAKLQAKEKELQIKEKELLDGKVKLQVEKEKVITRDIEIQTLKEEVAKSTQEFASVTSITKPEIKITQTMWALSYVKKAYASNTAYPEHTFFIIQGHNIFQRIELIVNSKNNLVQIDVDETINYVNEQEMNLAFLKVLHKFENEKLYTCTSEIYEKTWLVSRDKIDELRVACEQDKKNPPKYFFAGIDSILQPNYIRQQLMKPCISEFIGYINFAALFTQPLATIYNDMKLGDLNSIMTIKAYVPNLVSAKSLAKICYAYTLCSTSSLCSSFLYSWVNKDCIIPNPDSHNCDSWLREKLKNLNVEEISHDIQPHFFDKIMCSPSVHLGNKVEKLKAGLLAAGVPGNALFRSRVKSERAAANYLSANLFKLISSNPDLSFEGTSAVGR